MKAPCLTPVIHAKAQWNIKLCLKIRLFRVEKGGTGKRAVVLPPTGSSLFIRKQEKSKNAL